MIYLLYDLLLYLSAVFLVPYYLIRGLRYGKARHGLRERLGLYKPDLRKALKGKQIIWVHAVSVGETRAAIPLLNALRTNYPDAKLILSNVTETGRKIAMGIQAVDNFIFFPFDLRWVVRKAMETIKPDLVILVETELWPNFVLEAKQQKIPLVLVNGRISDRSFPRYRMAGKFLVPILDCISDFCMQSEQDSRRIRHLGASTGRVQVTGNLKFDMPLPDIAVDDVSILRQEFRIADDAVVWVAGSTHDGEEAQIVDTFIRLKKICPKLMLILVPRHPERVRNVVETLSKKNLLTRLRSELAPEKKAISEDEILVVDTLGEMLTLYAMSNVVFVGGSLVPIGGHNVLEASLVSKPVLFGPHMNNFKEIARLLKAAHGGLQVKDSEDLYRQMTILLENPSEAEHIGNNGNYLLDANQGATEKTLMVVSRYL